MKSGAAIHWVAVSKRFRKRLLLERDEARRDTRLKARFMSYRLNLPTSDESGVLLTVDDWKGLAKRAVPERQGSPIVGIDLGGGRAWSAAVAMWQSGRCEALAVAPGLPSIASQEARDRVQAGTYSALIQEGNLTTCEGLRVPPPGALWEAVRSAWGTRVLDIPKFLHTKGFQLHGGLLFFIQSPSLFSTMGTKARLVFSLWILPLYLILVTDPVPHDHGCALCLGSGSQFDPQRGPTGSLASASAVPRRGSTKEFVQIRHEPVVGGDQGEDRAVQSRAQGKGGMSRVAAAEPPSIRALDSLILFPQVQPSYYLS